MTQSIETWFVGSFANIQVGRYEYLWLIVIVTLLIFMYANRLTLAGLGEDVATSLGVNYNRIVLLGLLLSLLQLELLQLLLETYRSWG